MSRREQNETAAHAQHGRGPEESQEGRTSPVAAAEAQERPEKLTTTPKEEEEQAAPPSSASLRQRRKERPHHQSPPHSRASPADKRTDKEYTLVYDRMPLS